MLVRIAAVSLVAACYLEPEPPVLQNFAFVTSHEMPASSIAGLDGADRICQDAADAALLPGTYRAWMSTGVDAAAPRLGTARGWHRPDGKPFADTIGDILAGRIYYPLRIDENGDDVVNPVPLTDQTPIATGTMASGTDSFDCANFSGQPGADTLFGYPDATTIMWTDHAKKPCDTVARLYCFGIDVVGGVETPSDKGRLAFLTSRDFVPSSGGIDLADALCTSEASAAGHSGNFAAVIGRTDESIADHFSGVGPRWVRPDGIVVTTDFMTLEAPINVTLDGEYVGEVHTWGGAQSLTRDGSPDENCGNWAIPTMAGGGIVGLAGRSDKHVVFDSTQEPCSEGHPIACAEL